MQAEAGEVALEGEVMAEQPSSGTVEISAPRGPLGLVFDRGSTTLAKIKDSSPLSNLVQVGWTLVAVNDVDVEDLDLRTSDAAAKPPPLSRSPLSIRLVPPQTGPAVGRMRCTCGVSK